MKRTSLLGVAALGSVAILGYSGLWPSKAKEDALLPTLEVSSPFPDLRNDPRVRAFVQSYSSLVDSVAYLTDDVVFFLPQGTIHYQDGRMVAPDRVTDLSGCESIFYRYSLTPLSTPPPLPEAPVYCTDLMEALFGRTETEIRRHGQPTTFLGHRMFVNTLLLEPLRAIEEEIRVMAGRRPELATWIEDLDITFSFIGREIAGTDRQSYHAWGMAVDLVPADYSGKHVYWRWSRVFNRENWHRIPLSQRWAPPRAVVQAFERHGFVWGGKWAHFDQIHFEYRPEILAYNRMVNGD
jgi:hypothetical protein